MFNWSETNQGPLYSFLKLLEQQQQQQQRGQMKGQLLLLLLSSLGWADYEKF